MSKDQSLQLSDETKAQVAIYDNIDEDEGQSAYAPQPRRLRWATGGMRAFIEAVTGDAIPELTGIVAVSRINRVYWSQGFGTPGGAAFPDCFSTDGIRGSNLAINPKIACTFCPYSQFGSGGGTSRRPACRELRRLVVMPIGDGVPTIINVPPTSMRIWDQYCTGVRGKGLRYYSVVTKLTMEKTQNKEGIEYPKLKPEMVGTVSFEDLSKLIAIRDQLVTMISGQVTREDVIETEDAVEEPTSGEIPF